MALTFSLIASLISLTFSSSAVVGVKATEGEAVEVGEGDAAAGLIP